MSSDVVSPGVSSPAEVAADEESLNIECEDGFLLSGIWIHPVSAARSLVINSGTGIPKEFYLRFARYAASRGYATLIYDYRGIGGSRPKSLKGFHATMSDWGRLDMGAALRFAHERAPDAKRFVLGHSVGGQLLPLSDLAHTVSAAALITTSTGTWTKMSSFGYRMFCALIWYGLMPATTRTLGYLPAKALGQGEDLPLGVAREWGDWCKRDDYFASVMPADVLARFRAFDAPMYSLSFSDDPIANSVTVPALLAHYTGARVTTQHLTPKEANLKEVGHLGFFTKKAAHLWARPFDWFDTRAG